MRILVILMLSGTLGVLGCDSDDGGGGGMGGEGGAGGAGLPSATAFCTRYGTECGFDAAGYPSQDACETAYDGYDEGRQECVNEHLDNAVNTMNTALHCPHAAGEAPCN
jgi:hypothetical protein